jgi:hypothetical protein
VTAVIHIAGPDITIGPHVRQRCAWCGALLIDYNLDRVAIPVGQDPLLGLWGGGDLIAVDGNAKWVVQHADGDPLPAGACGLIDPEATR